MRRVRVRLEWAQKAAARRTSGLNGALQLSTQGMVDDQFLASHLDGEA